MIEPIPHDLTALRALRQRMDDQKATCGSAALRLVDVWDRRDRGEVWDSMEEDEENARTRVGAANDKAAALKAEWIAEWKRVGMPVGEY